MPTTSPFQAVSTAVIAIFNAEFATEGFTMIRDRLHESLGRQSTQVGIWPLEDNVTDSDALVLETWSEVRFYDLWTQEISPDTVVDPTRITAFAERFRRALQSSLANDTSTDIVWYLDVRKITYPPDPTGNSTRFHARIRAFGNNTALIETVG